MSLFVVVQRNKRSGDEYLDPDAPMGYAEYSAAQEQAQALSGDDWHSAAEWEFYVGRVVDVKTPVGEPHGVLDMS